MNFRKPEARVWVFTPPTTSHLPKAADTPAALTVGPLHAQRARVTGLHAQRARVTGSHAVPMEPVSEADSDAPLLFETDGTGVVGATSSTRVPAEWAPTRGIASAAATYATLHNEASLRAPIAPAPVAPGACTLPAAPFLCAPPPTASCACSPRLRSGLLHETFENQRFSRALSEWGGSYPSHLLASDRKPFTNRVGAPAAALEACTCPTGWEWIEEWRVDLAQMGCDDEGWCYGLSFEQLDRSFLVGEDDFGGAASGSIEVRARRWVRTRRRSTFRGGAPPPDRQLVNMPIGQSQWDSVVPDAAVLHEGYLCCQRAEGNLLSVHYCLLLADAARAGAALIFCDSADSPRVQRCLAHALAPQQVTLDSPRRPAAWDPRSCFHLGTPGPDQLLLRSLSAAACNEWLAVLRQCKAPSQPVPQPSLSQPAAGKRSTLSDAEAARFKAPLVPGRLRLVLLSGHSLAACDSN
eukprot:6357064-Prymnesium_polylepis.1